jgi:hypothetical protein
MLRQEEVMLALQGRHPGRGEAAACSEMVWSRCCEGIIHGNLLQLIHMED